MTLATGELFAADSADAQSREQQAARAASTPPRTNTFASLKKIDAGVLSIGYAESGPAGGPAVVLLHGWPCDIHSFVDVTPLLASQGYRLLVPYLRGYGTTRFLSSDAVRKRRWPKTPSPSWMRSE